MLLGLAFDIFSALSLALSTLFSIFMTIASTSTTIINLDAIMKNIYVVISVIMIFYVTISLLTYLISPDKLTDKSVGGSKLIIKIVITLTLLVFTPTIFSISRDLQTSIIRENVLGKLILSSGEEYGDDQFSSVSHNITEVLVRAFLKPVDSDPNDEMYDTMFFAGSTSMKELKAYAEDDAHYSFNWLMSIVCSVVLCLIVFGFLFDIAIRLVKLAFMELIAPIPIIANVSAKNNEIMNKWIKNTVSTYASLFIRLAIIFFFLYVITNIDVSISGSSEGVEGNPIIYAFVIIGALLFAKQLPQLIQDILGIKLDGDFTLNPMKRIREVPLLGSAVQTAGAAAGGLITGASLGFKAAGGFKGIGKAFKDDNGYLDLKGGMKNLGTMTGMAGRGMAFGGRAGFKQTKLMGVAAKEQNLDKGAYRAGASSVAQAITGNSDASAGFPDRLFNDMATHLNEPSYKQAKVISDAEKDYEKAVQQLSVLQDSKREIYSNMSAAIARKNSISVELQTIDDNIANVTSSRQEQINNETSAIDSAINQAQTDLGQAILRGDATAINNYRQQITTLQTQRATVEQEVDNRINQEVTRLRNEKTTVERQYNEANAVATDYTNQYSDITRQVTDQETDVVTAKQHVKDEKDKLKKMQGPYNKNK